MSSVSPVHPAARPSDVTGDLRIARCINYCAASIRILRRQSGLSLKGHQARVILSLSGRLESPVVPTPLNPHAAPWYPSTCAGARPDATGGGTASVCSTQALHQASVLLMKEKGKEKGKEKEKDDSHTKGVYQETNDHGAEYVCKSTGVSLPEEKVKPHLAAGTTKVAFSAPAKDDILTMGAYQETYDPSMACVSSASCPNGLAPLVKAINDQFGTMRGLLTSIHTKTASEPIQTAPQRPFESELGVQAPVGYWDPLGLAADGGVEVFTRRRVTEIKHGRISMLATMGCTTPELTCKLPGHLSPSMGLKFTDVPIGLGAIAMVPVAGWAEIVAYAFFCEYSSDFGENMPSPGDYGFKPPVLATGDAELKTKRLNAEIANGRLSMMAIIGMFFQDGLTGSAYGDWALYTDSPLRAFENELGVQAPVGFFDPLGFTSDGDVTSFQRRRSVEVKHGRIIMLATMGCITPELTGKFSGILSPSSGLKFAEVPNGLAALGKVPLTGWLQMAAYAGFCEAKAGYGSDVKNGEPGISQRHDRSGDDMNGQHAAPRGARQVSFNPNPFIQEFTVEGARCYGCDRWTPDPLYVDWQLASPGWLCRQCPPEGLGDYCDGSCELSGESSEEEDAWCEHCIELSLLEGG